MKKMTAVAAWALCLFGMPAQGAVIESNTWEYLKSLGDQVVFFTACEVPENDQRLVLIFPAGSTKGLIAYFIGGGESAYGGADVTKASEPVFSIGGGRSTMAATQSTGELLLKLPFTALRPDDFHEVFDSKVAACPE